MPDSIRLFQDCPRWQMAAIAALVLAFFAAPGEGRARATMAPVAETTLAEPPTGVESTIRLPVEVIGSPRGYVAERTVHVEDPAGITHLYARVHRPAYRDQLAEAERGAKASVKVGPSRWVDLTNENVWVAPRERNNHGIGGGPHTVRLAVPLDSVARGANVVKFRFNGTDGITSGYRVVDFNLRRGGPTGANVIPEAAYERADPAGWAAPEGYADADSVASGRALWYDARLVESLDQGLDREPIRATCSGCHADDGRDLKFFGFSNKSIRVRSQFHGLSASQGRKIAAYIRSVDVDVPPQGRPWNPPYQPGPGLDSVDARRWAAGAGIGAVLDDDRAMQSYLFGDRVEPADLAYDQELNLREQPVAIELPDWQAWLPNHHPADLWGDKFLNSTPVTKEDSWRPDVRGLYERARDALEKQGPTALAERGELKRYLEQFGGSARVAFLHMGGGLDARPEGVSREVAKLNLRQWGATKLWYLHQKHGLSDMGDAVFDQGAIEARTWLTGDARALFDLAPHLSADNDGNFKWQTPGAGKYRSSSWYHLQMVLNVGNNNGRNTRPVDWNYQPMHIKDMYLSGGASHPMRMTQTFAKMLQQYSSYRGLGGFWVRQIHPGMYAPGGKRAAVYDDMEDTELRTELYEALLTNLMDKIESHSRKAWIWKQYEGEHRNRLRDSTYVPKPVTNVPLARALQSHRWVDGWYTVIPRFRDAGVSEDLLTRMIDWAQAMWPRGDWDALRDPSLTQAASRVGR